MEAVKATIVSTLKNVSETLVTNVMEKLEECGCESLEDCKVITETDLCPPLKVVQCRKLIQVWNNPGEKVTILFST
jgi:hypothetical protein